MHVSAGRELGEVEVQRTQLAKEDKTQSVASLGKARLSWIGAVNSVLYVVERETGFTDADRHRLLEPLETALAKAEAKKKAKGKGTAEIEIEAEPE